MKLNVTDLLGPFGIAADITGGGTDLFGLDASTGWGAVRDGWLQVLNTQSALYARLPLPEPMLAMEPCCLPVQDLTRVLKTLGSGELDVQLDMAEKLLRLKRGRVRATVVVDGYQEIGLEEPAQDTEWWVLPENFSTLLQVCKGVSVRNDMFGSLAGVRLQGNKMRATDMYRVIEYTLPVPVYSSPLVFSGFVVDLLAGAKDVKISSMTMGPKQQVFFSLVNGGVLAGGVMDEAAFPVIDDLLDPGSVTAHVGIPSELGTAMDRHVQTQQGKDEVDQLVTFALDGGRLELRSGNQVVEVVEDVELAGKTEASWQIAVNPSHVRTGLDLCKTVGIGQRADGQPYLMFVGDGLVYTITGMMVGA